MTPDKPQDPQEGKVDEAAVPEEAKEAKQEAPAAEGAEQPEPKPKRTRKKKEPEAAAADETGVDKDAAEKPKRTRRKAAPEAEAAADEAEAKPKRARKKKADEPVAEEVAADETADEEPPAEEVAVEEPVAEEPPAEEAEADEPVAEEPPAEEPEAEEPVAEEPAPEESPAEEAAEPEPAAPARRPARRRDRRETVGAPVLVRAQAKYVRTSARKARLVCDHIRGKDVAEARSILAFTPRAAAKPWLKLLESAVANAEHNHELVGDDLRILSVHADEGPTLKRFRPRAMGRATRIRKRTSHLTITLTPKES